MRVIFMGTPDFAVPVLKSLIESRHDVCAVVTQPDRPVGRRQTLTPSPVKKEALTAGIPVLQPYRLRDEGVAEELAAFAPDVIVVAAFGQIVPVGILEMPKYGCLNVHASLLPRYRGASPIQWSIVNGDDRTGVTIMQMAKGLDTGDMLLTREVPLDGTETGGSLFEKLSGLGGPMILEVLDGLEAGTVTPVRQDDSLATTVRMLSRESGHIDWTMDAAAIERRVRAFDPWPSAYFLWEGAAFKVWKAAVADEESGAEPGTVIRPGKTDLLVQTGRGMLRILEIQAPGKKRMDTASFLRGFSLPAGSRLS